MTREAQLVEALERIKKEAEQRLENTSHLTFLGTKLRREHYVLQVGLSSIIHTVNEILPRPRSGK